MSSNVPPSISPFPGRGNAETQEDTPRMSHGDGPVAARRPQSAGPAIRRSQSAMSLAVPELTRSRRGGDGAPPARNVRAVAFDPRSNGDFDNR